MVPLHLLLLFPLAFLKIRGSIARKHLLQNIYSLVHLGRPVTRTTQVSLTFSLLEHFVVLLGKHEVLELFVTRNERVHEILAVDHVLTLYRGLVVLLHKGLCFAFRFVVRVETYLVVFDDGHILLVGLATWHGD